MAEAMSKADIKIVGGDGQFFDRFVRAMSLGQAVDTIYEGSGVVRQVVGEKLLGQNGKGAETLSALLGNLMIKADDSTKNKLKALLDQARQLGVSDDKVS